MEVGSLSRVPAKAGTHPSTVPGAEKWTPASAGERKKEAAVITDPSRNLYRWILPVAVFGSVSANSIQRGYFHTPMRSLTAFCRVALNASRAWSFAAS